MVKEVLESLIIKYQARRWDSARVAAAAAPKKIVSPKKTTAASKRAAPAASHR